MVGALWTGISGLAGQQTALDNESHNIANVNTIGYKASRISFADQMYQNNIGKGTQILNADKIYKQGNLKNTGVNYDVALYGDGFFSVKKTSSGTSETFYTRAGNFRMGVPGTLQDSLGNDVVGWSIRPEQEIVSSNPNMTKYSDNFTKLLASKIISYPTSIDTITAKATDYQSTAKADNIDIFSGAGLKTEYGKINDIEELIKNYNQRLTAHQSNPAISSINAIEQVSIIDLADQTNAQAVSLDGDEVYVYINGDKISQEYITAGTPAESYRKTMKAFADEISAKVPGLKAYTVENTPPYANSTKDLAVDTGVIKIVSLIPGKAFTIDSSGMVHSGSDKIGINTDIVENVEGQGVSALESATVALNKAVSGKQMDVYTPKDLGSMGAGINFSYRISIYDKGNDEVVNVPNAAPLTVVAPADIDALVLAINSDVEFKKYINAENINGNLVVKTLNTNFDVEFTGDLLASNGEIQTIALSAGPATGPVTFMGSVVAGSAAGDTDAQTVAKIISDKDALISAWNVANPTLKLKNIEGQGTNITLKYFRSEGPVAEPAAQTNNGITIAAAVEATAYAASVSEVVKANEMYSGREGAGAEFLQIITTIDQTATKNSLQLKLDTLGISDSAFGDFSVDKKGVITMKQDGATFAIGQIAIAKFITNRALEPMGDNLLRETVSSGNAIFSLNNNKTASIRSNTLELSTADLSESLVNLMVFQRAFEANAKSITTADTILNTLIQLKR